MCREKAVILDFDGVITRLNIDWDKLRSLVASKTGLKLNSFLAFFEENYGTKQYDIVHEIVTEHEVKSIEHSEPYEDIYEFLETISMYYPVFIASMQSEKSIKLFLEKYSLIKYFSEILGRDRFGSKRKQLEYLISKIGLPNQCIFFIDDLWRNIKVCEEIGIKCMHLDRKEGSLLELIKEINSLKSI